MRSRIWRRLGEQLRCPSAGEGLRPDEARGRPRRPGGRGGCSRPDVRAALKRVVTLEQGLEVAEALGPFVTLIGVFENAPLSDVQAAVSRLRLDAVQLHGSYPESYLAELRRTVKVIGAFSFAPDLRPQSVADLQHDALMLDGQVPGSGVTFDWRSAEAWPAGQDSSWREGSTPTTLAPR